MLFVFLLYHYSPVAKHSFGRIMEILHIRVKTVFTCSTITPAKVNRLGWNLEHYEHIVGDWPWQVLGAIRSVARVWEAAEISFFCQVNKARFYRFPVGQILRHFNITTSIDVAMWQNFGNYTIRGTQKLLTKFLGLATSGRRNYTMITDGRKFTNWSPYGMSSFHFYR